MGNDEGRCRNAVEEEKRDLRAHGRKRGVDISNTASMKLQVMTMGSPELLWIYPLEGSTK